jgi:hypothetical protein
MTRLFIKTKDEKLQEVFPLAVFSKIIGEKPINVVNRVRQKYYVKNVDFIKIYNTYYYTNQAIMRKDRRIKKNKSI